MKEIHAIEVGRGYLEGGMLDYSYILTVKWGFYSPILDAPPENEGKIIGIYDRRHNYLVWGPEELQKAEYFCIVPDTASVPYMLPPEGLLLAKKSIEDILGSDPFLPMPEQEEDLEEVA